MAFERRSGSSPGKPGQVVRLGGDQVVVGGVQVVRSGCTGDYLPRGNRTVSEGPLKQGFSASFLSRARLPASWSSAGCDGGGRLGRRSRCSRTCCAYTYAECLGRSHALVVVHVASEAAGGRWIAGPCWCRRTPQGPAGAARGPRVSQHEMGLQCLGQRPGESAWGLREAPSKQPWETTLSNPQDRPVSNPWAVGQVSGWPCTRGYLPSGGPAGTEDRHTEVKSFSQCGVSLCPRGGWFSRTPGWLVGPRAHLSRCLASGRHTGTNQGRTPNRRSGVDDPRERQT